MNPPPPSPFAILSTYAVVFSGLSALFGVYFVVFILAVWGTYRHNGIAHKRLRWMTIVLFIDLCIHYIARAVTFGRARLENPPADEMAKRSVPLCLVTVLSTTVAGTLSDGLLAWRFYVVSGRRRYALWAACAAIAVNTMLGLSGNFQFLTFYTHRAEFPNMLQVTYELNAAWGWCMLGINTVLSSLTIWKIVRVSRTARPAPGSTGLGRYSVVVEAIAESALVTWIGLVLYGVGSLAPQGKITTHWDIGYVIGCILPMFFGISQCLITARLGFAFDSSCSPDAERGRGLAATYPACGCARIEEPPKGIAIMVKRETESVSVDEHGAIIEERKSRAELYTSHYDEDGSLSVREPVVETTVTLPRS